MFDPLDVFAIISRSLTATAVYNATTASAVHEPYRPGGRNAPYSRVGGARGIARGGAFAVCPTGALEDGAEGVSCE